MRPVYGITLSSLGTSAPVVLDYNIPPENTTWEAIVSPGSTLTYNIEYSISDPYAQSNYNTGGNWFPLTTATGLSATSSSNTQFPARALRVRTTAYTSGLITFAVLQAGATT